MFCVLYGDDIHLKCECIGVFKIAKVSEILFLLEIHKVWCVITCVNSGQSVSTMFYFS